MVLCEGDPSGANPACPTSHVLFIQQLTICVPDSHAFTAELSGLLRSTVRTDDHDLAAWVDLDIELGEADRSKAIKEAIEAGQDIWQFILGGAYEPDELIRLIVAARWYYDYTVRSSPPLRATTMDTYAEAIVLMAGTSARLMEACRLQWHHVREDLGVLVIPGTKTLAALRGQPIQNSLLPWIRHLRETFQSTYGREPSGQDYLIQTDPRQPRKRPASRGMGERVGIIQEVAGLKRPNKASHILRATYVSAANAKGANRERLKTYIGHASTDGKGRTEIIDTYIKTLVDLIQPEDRRIMDFIPTPEEVQRMVSEFEPTIWPSRGAGAPGRSE